MTTSQTTMISPTDPYLKALCKEQYVEKTADYFQKQCRLDPRYSVASVDYKLFKCYGYTPPKTYGEWASRKATHLFAPIWTLGVKAPFHTIKAFTVGPCTGTFRTNLYRAGTDIQATTMDCKSIVCDLAWNA